MKVLLKKLSGKLSAGSWFSGHPEIRTVEMTSDIPAIEELLQLEEWPLVREDLEVSYCQPGAVFNVAIKDGAFAGFFAVHSFGRVGYLYLMLIDPKFRRKGIARPLYFKTLRSVRASGAHGYVLHTTNDSARIIQLLGFKPGREFTLLVRPAANVDAVTLQELDYRDRDALVALDAEVFGLARPEWIGALPYVWIA
jgi:N-acetylglutamate synthase-like GNAT family acetyltransferase